MKCVTTLLYAGLLYITPIVCFSQSWVARYNGSANYDDLPKAITVDIYGNVYVTGLSCALFTGFDYTTIKYDATGMEQWVASFNSPVGNHYDEACDVVVDNSGNVYVTGESMGFTNSADYVTIKYDSTGEEQWIVRYDSPYHHNDRVRDLVIDDMGYFYITGMSNIDGFAADYATIKYDTSGSEQWVTRYSGAGNQYNGANAIAVDEAGNVYVTGDSEISGNAYDFATVKYNSSGIEQWSARYNGPASSQDQAVDIVVDDSGNVYVTGSSIGSGTDYDFAVIKYNPSGVEQWVARYNGPGNDVDFVQAMDLDSYGNIYITGYSYASDTHHDYATIKYNSAGEIQWAVRYDGSCNESDWAMDMVIDDNDNVFVTGYSSNGSGTNKDYCTVMYNTAGIEQWSGRYNAPGNSPDYAKALAVDESGNIFVTGYSFNNSTLFDYATVKYSPTGIMENEQTIPHNFQIAISPNPFTKMTKATIGTVHDIKGEVKNTLNTMPLAFSANIYDASGRLVKDFSPPTPYSMLPAGFTWDGTDNSGHQLPAGTYFLHVTINDETYTRPVILLR